MQMYQVCCTLQIADCNSNCHKQITLGGLQEVVSGSQTNIKAKQESLLKTASQTHPYMQPTLYNRYCHSRTLFQHSSYSYSHIILNPMEEFYSLLRRGSSICYINPLCDLTLLSGFTPPEKKKTCEPLRRREGILRECLT